MLAIISLRRRLLLNMTRRSSLSFNTRHSYFTEDASSDMDTPSSEWYAETHSSLVDLGQRLQTIHQADGKLINIEDDSIIRDDAIDLKMKKFKSLARDLIGSPWMQQALKERSLTSAAHPMWGGCFGKTSERDTLTLRSLTKVCALLDIPVQQRKTVRHTVSTQVTQHHILMNTLQQILTEMNAEMQHLGPKARALKMGEQIVRSCIKFFEETTVSPLSNSPSWMRLAATRKPDSEPLRWSEPLEMIIDLTDCLKNEGRLVPYVSKLEAMKEGLYQVQDVMVDRDMGYRQAREQECLVRKKLSQSLGHSSECLFTLLLNYLYGSVNNVEVDLRGGGLCGKGDRFHLSFGEILTSADERMIWRGVRHLDRVLRLFTFVWEIAGMKGSLGVQGHLWVVGAEEGRVLEYRQNGYFLHGIGPSGQGC